MIPASPQRLRRIFLAAACLAAALWLGGCASMAARAARDVTGNLTAAVLNSDDPETVREGGPAYLIMIDGLVRSDAENPAVLSAGAKLYTAYAAMFVEDGARQALMTEKARDYALRAACARGEELCGLDQGTHEAFEAAVAQTSPQDVDALYTLATAWAGYIQAHKSDWGAVAQLPRVEVLMRRVLALDESHANAGAHLYLGTLATLVPAALGGKPGEGRAHFERAIELTQGRNLMARVLYARQYARNVFDRELHDRLLEEVLAADPHEEGLTLANVIAQREARSLLDSADEYF